MTRARDNADFGHIAGRRNLVINGDPIFWQRRASINGLTSGVLYGPDRWRFSVAGHTLYAYNNNTADDGFEPQGFQKLLRVTAAAGVGAGDYVYMRQRMEALYATAGERLTVSFWARDTAAATKTIGLVVGQNFGSGGSTAVNFPLVAVELTNVMQRFDFTFDMPSLAGKTIGTSPFLEVGFYFSAGATYNEGVLPLQSFNTYMTGLQVERDDRATPFELRNPADELLLCQRYYEKSYPIGVVPGTASNTNGAIYHGPLTTTAAHYVPVRYQTRKRSAATFTVWNPETGASGSAQFTDGSNQPVSAVYGTGEQGAAPRWNIAAAGWSIIMHYTAESEL